MSVAPGLAAAPAGATRVVITGVGTVNGLGAGAAAAVGPLLESGRSAVAPVGTFSTAGLGSHLAGEIGAGTLAALIDDAGEARRMSRLSRMTVAACRLAARDAGLEGDPDVHLVVGSEFGDLRSTEQFAAGYLERGIPGLSPLTFPSTVMNTMAATASIALGLRGASITLNARRAAGALAVVRARQLIACGRARAVLAGGVDEISATMFAALARLGLLSPRGGGAEGARPFDRSANGPVRGEGATFLMLETLASATARGARVLGELRAAVSRARVPASAVSAALAAAGLAPDDVPWIYGGAAGDPAQDAAEVASIRTAFGRRAPAVTALAPVFGEHSGLGALRLAAAVWTARTGRLPGIASLDTPTDAARGLVVGPGVHPVPAGPGLVHEAFPGGDSVALVVDAA